MYTIGQVSTMYGLPVSTLRYYDKMGLFRDLKRESGIRKFDDQDLDRLDLIECMKKSGLEIKDIKLYMDWCAEGPSTYEARLGLFNNQLEAVEKEMAHLECTRAMLLFKQWYYEELLAGATEEDIKALLPDKLPAKIQALYDLAHSTDRSAGGEAEQAA